MTGTIFIGVDPGANGGIAVLCGESVILHPMPPTMLGLHHLIQAIEQGCHSGVILALEKVGGYVGKSKDGKESDTGSSMFTFGFNAGCCWMALTSAFGQQPEMVAPITWQTAMGCLSLKGETKSAHKRRMKEMAQSLFPSEKVIGKVADALLIVYWLRSKHQ